MTATFESDRFQWRETYFVVFDSSRRPLLADVERAVRAVGSRFQLNRAGADESGRMETLTVMSPEDHAALEIEYLSGVDVREQGAKLATEMQPGERAERDKLARLRQCDARFEVMHFEQLVDEVPGGEEVPGDEADDMLDPSALLVVLDVLVQLTGGVGIDPQSGTFL